LCFTRRLTPLGSPGCSYSFARDTQITCLSLRAYSFLPANAGCAHVTFRPMLFCVGSISFTRDVSWYPFGESFSVTKSPPSVRHHTR